MLPNPSCTWASLSRAPLGCYLKQGPYRAPSTKKAAYVAPVLENPSHALKLLLVWASEIPALYRAARRLCTQRRIDI